MIKFFDFFLTQQHMTKLHTIAPNVDNFQQIIFLLCFSTKLFICYKSICFFLLQNFIFSSTKFDFTCYKNNFCCCKTWFHLLQNCMSECDPCMLHSFSYDKAHTFECFIILTLFIEKLFVHIQTLIWKKKKCNFM